MASAALCHSSVPVLFHSYSLQSHQSHAGYIQVHEGYILVHAGYIPVHEGYIIATKIVAYLSCSTGRTHFLFHSYSLQSHQSHAGYIPVHEGHSLVHAGYIPVHEGYISATKIVAYLSCSTGRTHFAWTNLLIQVKMGMLQFPSIQGRRRQLHTEHLF